MPSLIKFRNYLVLWTIMLYLALNYGFMVIRFPPSQGAGVPIAELALLISLVTIHYPTLLGQMAKVYNPTPLLLFFVLGIIGALKALPEHGMWAMRDATHEIESLYLLVGFAVAGRIDWLQKIFRWLPILITVVIFYNFTYPVRAFLDAHGPAIHGAAGQRVPILANYLNTYTITLWGVAMLVIWEKKVKGINYTLLSGFLIAFVIFFYQSRTIYLEIAGLMLLMAWKKPEVNRKLFMALGLFLVLLVVISMTGIEIKGRLGEKVNITFLLEHLKAVVGIHSDSAGVSGAADGNHLRVSWWIKIYHDMTSSLHKLFLGLGFGIPLTDFRGPQDVLVREPHNSYVSVTARMGLIGLAVLVWMYVSLIQSWKAAYRRCVRLRWDEGERILLFFLSYFILIWIFSITEDGMEKPFNAISFYFFWGVVLRFALYLKNGEIGPDSEQPQPVENSLQ